MATYLSKTFMISLIIYITLISSSYEITKCNLNTACGNTKCNSTDCSDSNGEACFVQFTNVSQWDTLNIQSSNSGEGVCIRIPRCVESDAQNTGSLKNECLKCTDRYRLNGDGECIWVSGCLDSSISVSNTTPLACTSGGSYDMTNDCTWDKRNNGKVCVRCEQNYKLSFDATACVRIQGCIVSTTTNPIFKKTSGTGAATADFTITAGQEGLIGNNISGTQYYHEQMIDNGDMPVLQSFRTSHTQCTQCNTNYRQVTTLANEAFPGSNNHQYESECLWVSGCASGDGNKCQSCQDGYYLVQTEMEGKYWNRTYADDPWSISTSLYGFMKYKGLNQEGILTDTANATGLYNKNDNFCIWMPGCMSSNSEPQLEYDILKGFSQSTPETAGKRCVKCENGYIQANVPPVQTGFLKFDPNGGTNIGLILITRLDGYSIDIFDIGPHASQADKTTLFTMLDQISSEDSYGCLKVADVNENTTVQDSMERKIFDSSLSGSDYKPRAQRTKLVCDYLNGYIVSKDGRGCIKVPNCSKAELKIDQGDEWSSLEWPEIKYYTPDNEAASYGTAAQTGGSRSNCDDVSSNIFENITSDIKLFSTNDSDLMITSHVTIDGRIMHHIMSRNFDSSTVMNGFQYGGTSSYSVYDRLNVVHDNGGPTNKNIYYRPIQRQDTEYIGIGADHFYDEVKKKIYGYGCAYQHCDESGFKRIVLDAWVHNYAYSWDHERHEHNVDYTVSTFKPISNTGLPPYFSHTVTPKQKLYPKIYDNANSSEGMETLLSNTWSMWTATNHETHFPYYRRMNHFSTCLRVTFCAKSDGEDCIQCNNGYRLDTSGLGCIRIIGGDTTNISFLRCTNKSISGTTIPTREDFEYFNAPSVRYRNYSNATDYYCQIRKNTTMHVQDFISGSSNKLYLKTGGSVQDTNGNTGRDFQENCRRRLYDKYFNYDLFFETQSFKAGNTHCQYDAITDRSKWFQINTCQSGFKITADKKGCLRVAGLSTTPLKRYCEHGYRLVIESTTSPLPTIPKRYCIWMAACKYTTDWLQTNFYPNFGCYHFNSSDVQYKNPFNDLSQSSDSASGCQIGALTIGHQYKRHTTTPGTEKFLNTKLEPGYTGEASCAQCDNLYKLSANRTACIRMSGAASGSWQPESCQTGYRLNLVSDNYQTMSGSHAPSVIYPDQIIHGSGDSELIWGPSVNLRWNNQWLDPVSYDLLIGANDYILGNTNSNAVLTKNEQWRMLTNALLVQNESFNKDDVEYVYERNCVWVSGCSKLNDSSGTTMNDAQTYDVDQFCVDCQNNFRLSIEEPKIWIKQRGWLPTSHSDRKLKTIAFRSGCIEVEGCMRNRPTDASDYTSSLINLNASTSCGGTASGCTKHALTASTDHKYLPSPLHCMYCSGSNKKLTLSVGRRDSAEWFGLDITNILKIDHKTTQGEQDTFVGAPSDFGKSTPDPRDLKNLYFKPLNFSTNIYYHYFPHPTAISPDPSGTNWGQSDNHWSKLSNPTLQQSSGSLFEIGQKFDRSNLPHTSLNYPNIKDDTNTALGSYTGELKNGVNQFRITCEDLAQ